MNTISTIRTLLRGALLAACIPALALPALAATAGGSKANATTHLSAAPAAKGGSAHSGQTMPAALRPVLYQALAKDAGTTYDISKDGCAILAKQTLKACFDTDGAHFSMPVPKAAGTTYARSADTPLSLHLAAWGRGNALATVTTVQPTINDNQASYAHKNITEWWRVLPVGFEQSFTITKRPVGRGELVLTLAASRRDAGASTTRHFRAEPAPAKAWGGNPVETSPSIPLRSEGGKEIAWGKLRYGQLVVTDAKGKVVQATLKTKGDRILIAVNDAHVVYPLTVDPLVWLEQKVVASDGQAYDNFGNAVAVDGSTALIGADQYGSGGSFGPGAVYVFSESGGVWQKTAKLMANDGASGDAFGHSVALGTLPYPPYGPAALIGAPGATVNGNSGQGAAYLFYESNGTWTQGTKFDADGEGGAAGDALGSAVAIDGSYVMAGAPFATVTAEQQGAVYMWQWSNPYWYGYSALTASDAQAYDWFGSSVALDGTGTLLIGAPHAFVNGPDQGAVYVFMPSLSNWTQSQKLTASDGGENDQFGSSVALDDATVLVGALGNFGNKGAAYVYDDSNGTWTQEQKLTASDGATGDQFGFSVAIEGTTALVGADDAGVGDNADQGAAYEFSESDGIWTQTQKLSSSDGAPDDHFGDSVALSGTNSLVGADQDSYYFSGTGVAYFYNGPGDLDLLATAPSGVDQGSTYLLQAFATNEASVTSPAAAVTVTVPAAASFVSATATQGDCDQSSGVVTCDFGTIGAGNVAIASINLKATGGGGHTLENSASVSHGVPQLSDTAPTVIYNACPDGYNRYRGTLGPDGRYRTPPYQSAAGKQTVTFNAPPDFVLHVGYQKDAQSQWVIRTFPSHAIYKYGPAGTYEWQINAGPDGGAYTLCILHS